MPKGLDDEWRPMSALNFFLRKSISLGPLRLNLSKSGVGASFGMTGLRLGAKPGGHTYVTGGRAGLYFRKTLTPMGRPSAPAPPVSSGPTVSEFTSDPNFAEGVRLYPRFGHLVALVGEAGDRGRTFRGTGDLVPFLREHSSEIPGGGRIGHSLASNLADLMIALARKWYPQPESVEDGIGRLVLSVAVGAAVLVTCLFAYVFVERPRQPTASTHTTAPTTVSSSMNQPTRAVEAVPHPAPAPVSVALIENKSDTVVSVTRDGSREWTMPDGTGTITLKRPLAATPAP